MTRDPLERHQRRLARPAPLLGRWQQRRAAEALAEEGSIEAARSLALAVARCTPGETPDYILAALGQLTDRSALDVVGEVWAETRHPDLERLIVRHGWVASAPPPVRVLTALKTG